MSEEINIPNDNYARHKKIEKVLDITNSSKYLAKKWSSQVGLQNLLVVLRTVKFNLQLGKKNCTHCVGGSIHSTLIHHPSWHFSFASNLPLNHKFEFCNPSLPLEWQNVLSACAYHFWNWKLHILHTIIMKNKTNLAPRIFWSTSSMVRSWARRRDPIKLLRFFFILSH